MGYLKGRWSSLCGLRLRINNEEEHMFATLWIASYIHLHNFVIGQERKENPEVDLFYIEGQWYMDIERQQGDLWREERRAWLQADEANYQPAENIELLEGKIRQEELKRALFDYLEND